MYNEIDLACSYDLLFDNKNPGLNPEMASGNLTVLWVSPTARFRISNSAMILRPRMEFFMNLMKKSTIYVGVDFSRIDRRVSQHRLNRAQASPSLQEVGGKRVAEDVWIDIFFNSRFLRILLYNIPDRHTGERPSSLIEK